MSEIYKKYLFLGISILFLIGYHIISFQVHYGGDDLDYVHFAQQMLHGKFSLSSETFSARVVPIGLLALSFSVFGINDFSTVLPFMLTTIGTLLILLGKSPKVDSGDVDIIFFCNRFLYLNLCRKSISRCFCYI